MFLRWLIGIVIVSFWLVMTVLLVRMAYFPDDSQLALESPQVVMERFLSRANNPDMTPDELDIWKGSKIVGSMRVVPQPLPKPEHRRLNAHGRVRIDARLGLNIPYMGDSDMILAATLDMDTKSNVKQSDVTLKMDRMNLSLHIVDKGDGKSPHVVLTQHDVELFNTASLENTGSSQQMITMILASVGMNTSDIEKRQAAAKAEADGMVTEARRGGFEVRGKQFNGYRLTTTLGGGGGRKFVLSVSDSGELIAMTTSFLDYDFVSDSLRPSGMQSYENQKLQDIQKTLPPAPAPTPNQ